jgi:hypothetical protein
VKRLLAWLNAEDKGEPVVWRWILMATLLSISAAVVAHWVMSAMGLKVATLLYAHGPIA